MLLRFRHLVWGGLTSRKWSYLASFAALLICFLLAFYLLAFSRAMSRGVQLSGMKRLVVWHKTSVVELLPISYVDQIAKLDDVAQTTHRTFFGGYYRDPGNQVPMWAVDPASFMAFYPEYRFRTSAERDDFLAGGEGIAVGSAAAAAFGWKLGDRVPISSIIWENQDDTNVWTFRVAAIFDGADGSASTNQVLIPFGAFNEGRGFGKNGVNYIEVTAKTDAAAPGLAKRIDALFENSEKPTRTSTLSGFLQSFASQIGDIGSLVITALAVVVLTVSTMLVGQFAHGFSLRRQEFGILKTIGFSNGVVCGLIVGESMALCFGAAFLALLCAAIMIDKTGQTIALFVSGFYLSIADVAAVMGIALLMSLISAALPVFQVRSLAGAR